MSIAEKLRQIAENEQKVYDAGLRQGGYEDGRQAERTAFWEIYLSDGSLKRASYMFAEPRFGSANFYPTRDIRPVGRAQNLFYNFGAEVNGVKEDGFDLRERLQECGVSLDLSQATNLTYCFSYTRFTGLPALDFTGCGSDTIGVFEGMGRLAEIYSITVDKDNVFSGWFTNCTDLREVSFYGNIANDIDVHWSKKLSRGSIEGICWAAWGGYVDNEGNAIVTLSVVAVDKAYETSVGANDGSTSAEWNNLVNDSWSTLTIILI